MLSLRIRCAAYVAVSLLAAGCGSLRCGGPACGDGCGKGCSFAGMKYESCCETCGGGFCAGEGCGGNCNGSCAKTGCKGCRACGCGKQSPCWLLNCFATCAGCGERYWNEWYNDPPRCAEPCDCYGNWVGPGHGGYYRAPYLNDPYLIGEKPADEPLEIAEGDPVENEPAQQAATASLEQSDAAVNAAATAEYDDSQLAEGLK